MRPDSYKLLEMCVENGINLGYRRAFKHNDDPSEQVIKDYIQTAIMAEISEWFAFDDPAAVEPKSHSPNSEPDQLPSSWGKPWDCGCDPLKVCNSVACPRRCNVSC